MRPGALDFAVSLFPGAGLAAEPISNLLGRLGPFARLRSIEAFWLEEMNVISRGSMARALLATLLATLLAAPSLRAGPLVTGTARGSSYSPWAFRTPTLYRWSIQHHAPPIVQYTSAGCTYPAAPAIIATFPCPAVPPEAYYANTGLSYEPARPLILGPPVAAPNR